MINKSRKGGGKMPVEKRMFLCRLLKEMELHEASAQRIGIYDASTFRGERIKTVAEQKQIKGERL